MPTYSFENISTGETLTTLCTWKEAKKLVDDGEYKMLLSAPRTVSGTGTVVGKIDNGFNDVLKRIKSANYRSSIRTK
jgi:hypothetical protein